MKHIVFKVDSKQNKTQIQLKARGGRWMWRERGWAGRQRQQEKTFSTITFNVRKKTKDQKPS